MKSLKLINCHTPLDAFEANLSNSRFQEISLVRSTFKEVQMDDIQFEECSFSGVTDLL